MASESIIPELLMPDDGTAADTLSGPLLYLVWGHVIAQALHAAARLGIIDELADGPKSAAGLSRSAGANQEHLIRLLRALTTLSKTLVAWPDRRTYKMGRLT